MLDLLIFAPCERVIVGQDENNSTLISILETVNITVPIGVEIPEEAVIPLRWTIYALWYSEADAVGVSIQYEQRTKLVGSDDKAFFETTLPFTVPANVRNHRTTIQLPGFPFMAPGPAKITLELREARQGAAWEEIAEFPIWINRVQ